MELEWQQCGVNDAKCLLIEPPASRRVHWHLIVYEHPLHDMGTTMQFTKVKCIQLLHVHQFLLGRAIHELSSLGTNDNIVMRHKTLHPSWCHLVGDQVVINWVSEIGIEFPSVLLIMLRARGLPKSAVESFSPVFWTRGTHPPALHKHGQPMHLFCGLDLLMPSS